MKKLIVMIWLVAGSALAGGWGSSVDGVFSAVAYNHYIAADSGRLVFGYPDLATNAYDTVILTADSFDGTTLYFDSLFLDSIGLHQVEVTILVGAVTVLDTVTWLHFTQSPVLEAPAGSPLVNVCRVYGYTWGVKSGAVEFVRVTATLPNDTYDSCAGVVMMDRSTDTLSRGDSARFALDLRWSSCLGDQKYTFTFKKRGMETITQKFTVPDTNSIQISWDD